MTPKERVLMTIAHEEPDRVPTGEWEFGHEMPEALHTYGQYKKSA